MATKQAEKIAKAYISNLNISPRKVRLVANLIKGQSVVAAIAQLQAIPNRSSVPIEKLINSAVANAREKNMDLSKLVVANLTVDKGRVLRRGKAKARGRVGIIEHKQSHVDLTLAEVPDLKGPQYVLPQKVKKVKEIKQTESTSEKDKPQFKEVDEKKEKPKLDKKGGFAKKFFQRKSI